MDRPIIYPLSVPNVTDLLYGWQRTMVALSKLASTVLGPSPTGAWLDGFDITLNGGLNVQVSAGQAYVKTEVDANSYGVLPPDDNQILRQFLLDQNTSFSLTTPTTEGYSITYLIEIGYETIDTEDLILQYFNVADPSVAFGGPGNSGQSQPTQRQDVCTVTLISGAPGPTGSQQQPGLSGNGIGGYYITVAYGQTTLSSSDVTTVNASPFVNLKLPYAAGTQISNTFTQPQSFESSISGTTGNFSGTVSGADATESSNFVPLGQLGGVLFEAVHTVTSDRAIGTQYTNSTGKPMQVCVTVNSTNATGNLFLYANGALVAENHNDPIYDNILVGITGIVPAGATYEVQSTLGTDLQNWTETY